MTVQEYIDKSGSTYKRARDLEEHLLALAVVSEAFGFKGEGKTLRFIASRAIPCADKFVTSLRLKIEVPV